MRCPWGVLVCASLALGACAGPDPGAAEGEAAQEEHVLLDSAREPLDRARAVEDITAERKDQLDAEIEGSE